MLIILSYETLKFSCYDLSRLCNDFISLCIYSFGVQERGCGKDEKRQHVLPSGWMAADDVLPTTEDGWWTRTVTRNHLPSQIFSANLITNLILWNWSVLIGNSVTDEKFLAGLDRSTDMYFCMGQGWVVNFNKIIWSSSVRISQKILFYNTQ